MINIAEVTQLLGVDWNIESKGQENCCSYVDQQDAYVNYKVSVRHHDLVKDSVHCKDYQRNDNGKVHYYLTPFSKCCIAVHLTLLLILNKRVE